MAHHFTIRQNNFNKLAEHINRFPQGPTFQAAFRNFQDPLFRERSRYRFYTELVIP